MAEIAFHSGLADKLGYACRLLRKAYRQGLRVQVRGQPDELARLDPLLWTFEQLEFIPHVRLRAGQTAEATLQRTPIWLVDPGAEAPPAGVLVNLGPQPADDAAGFERIVELVVIEADQLDDAAGFERIVELVGLDDDERQSGRRRWRYYETLGLKPKHIAAPAA
jgi:DNA polymerase III subunit chi